MERSTILPALLLAVFAFVLPLKAEVPTVRVAVMASGTVNWEISTIRGFGLDTANGFALEVEDMAGGTAARVAFQGGEADVIVSDWIWVARQRSSGKDYVFVPYSRAVGGLMVPADSTAKSLADLEGGKIGIAGGPLDKSWIILRAYATKSLGMDLEAETEQVFGAPPLIYKSGLSGEIDGAINYWHFMARMRAAGMTELISVAEAAEALGLDPEMPLLGYVFKGEMLRDNPELVASFVAASRAAKDVLASNDAAWDELRPNMPASNETEFEELKAGFIAGYPGQGSVDIESAKAVFELMGELGGEELVGASPTLPSGVFYEAGE